MVLFGYSHIISKKATVYRDSCALTQLVIKGRIVLHFITTQARAVAKRDNSPAERVPCYSDYFGILIAKSGLQFSKLSTILRQSDFPLIFEGSEGDNIF